MFCNNVDKGDVIGDEILLGSCTFQFSDSGKKILETNWSSSEFNQ